MSTRQSEGIETRHKRGCRSRSGGRCNCDPSYRASVWSPVEEKLIRQELSFQGGGEDVATRLDVGARTGGAALTE